MSLPSTFGDFWPAGRFEGDPHQPLSPDWFDRLRADYLALTAGEQRELFDHRGDDSLAAHKYPFYVCSKFTIEQGIVVNVDTPPITPVRLHEPPRYYQTEKSQKSLGSLIKLNDQIISVSENLKSVIEKLEPGVHQFFPIEILMPRKKTYKEQYYTLIIGQYFNSFSPEDSVESSFTRTDLGNFRFIDSKKGISGLAFRKSNFGAAHLWRARHVNGCLTCFSDELRAAITEADLRLPKHHQMMEV